MEYYDGTPLFAKPRELERAYVELLPDAASFTTGVDILVAGIVHDGS